MSVAPAAGERRPDGRADLGGKVRRLLGWLWRLFPLFALPVAGLALHRLLERTSYAEIAAAVRAAPLERVVGAAILAGLAYAAFALCEVLAVRYTDRRVPVGQAALTGFCAYAVSNTLGNPLFTSTPLRLRIYGALGLTTLDVVHVLGFTWSTFALGVLVVGSAALLVESQRLAELSGLAPELVIAIGVVFALSALAYLAACAARRGPLRLGTYRFELPAPRLAAGQLACAILDWTLTAAALWVLLPAGRPSYWLVLTLFLVAHLIGLLSHVPGGLGVFDAALAFLLAPWIEPQHAAAALLGFRFVYHAIPFALACGVLLVSAARARRRQLEQWARAGSGWLVPLAPSALGVATFAAGAVLLVSGSAPELGERLRLVRRVLPLSIYEISHLLSSVVGAALLFLARGLRRRLDGAFFLTAGLLAVGVVAALLRGFDWREATVLGLLLAFLLASRDQFHRRASLLAQPVSLRWLGAVGLVVAGAVWLGLFAHQQVDYRSELWWQFSFSGDAPRFLRATFAGVAVLGLGGVAMLLRPTPPPPRPPLPEEEELIAAIVERSPRVNATLAFLGDKSFLFNDQRTAFVMYGLSGDSAVAMGDPVGPEEERPELVWRFRELCDRYHENPVFYQVHPASLSLYLDVGLSAFKLGEAGRVSLPDLSLEGGSRRGLRGQRNRALREGASFEVISRQEARSLLDRFEHISDQWLVSKNASEKSFSLGAFRRPYVEHFPYAVVRREGEIVAFANVLATGDKQELSVDLMRYSESAPPAVMDYLFIELMLWGKENGYQWFNLGMAPLSGLESHELAPLWNRIGSLVFRHGEHFYNFQGLRDYKEKFDPRWEPRYLVMRGGLGAPGALLDVATLISGGVAGLVSR